MEEPEVTGATEARADSPESSSRRLLRRAREGDRGALEQLFERHLPMVHRWARRRLPRWARDIADTADLVQDVLLQTFRNLKLFEPRREHALQSYLRQAIHNRLSNEFRRFDRRPAVRSLDEDHAVAAPSPLDVAVANEDWDRYLAALQRLTPGDRELIVGRAELGYNYEQLAEATGRASAEAARVALRRALVRLAAEMARA